MWQKPAKFKLTEKFRHFNEDREGKLKKRQGFMLTVDIEFAKIQ